MSSSNPNMRKAEILDREKIFLQRAEMKVWSNEVRSNFDGGFALFSNVSYVHAYVHTETCSRTHNTSRRCAYAHTR